jgi:hypothetical protein
VAFQAQQIVQLACATAKVPGWVSQGGIMLNMILNELCTDYDLSVNRFTFNFSFNTGAGQNSGPYTLPLNWLRADKDDVFYTIQGVKYIMIPETLAQFNSQVQQPGLNAYPQNYAVDNSPIQAQGAPLMYVWPPAGGAYAVTCVYYGVQPDIATPETSTTIPWFPLQLYLLRRLAGEMMLMSNDDRAEKFLGGASKGDGVEFLGAAEILRRYLKNEGDSQTVKTVSLDRRLFQSYQWDELKNTKTVGW